MPPSAAVVPPYTYRISLELRILSSGNFERDEGKRRLKRVAGGLPVTLVMPGAGDNALNNQIAPPMAI